MVNFAAASLVGLSCLSTIISAAPFVFDNNPFGKNFPNPDKNQISAIQTQAHGSIPNAKPPATVKPSTLTTLRFIAFNEIFEVAFYTQLIQNITNYVPGYEIKDEKKKQKLLANLVAIQAQEEVHALNANNALKNFKVDPIQPCKYSFPVDNVNDAIALASTFTDLVLGTLQDIEQTLAMDGDAGLTRGVAAVIGQEGEQNGYFRTFGGKIASALPFLTTSTRDFAFSALNQAFVIKDSCPNSKDITLKIFNPLTVDVGDLPKDPKPQNIKFSFQLPEGGVKPEWKSDWTGLSLAYINQQNVPVKAQLSGVKVDGSKVSFEALFPFDAGTFGNGLTVAALVNADADFSTAVTVSNSTTVFGPALIEVN